MVHRYLDRIIHGITSELKEMTQKYQLTRSAGDEIRHDHASLIGDEIGKTVKEVLEKFNVIEMLRRHATRANINCLHKEIKTHIPQVIASNIEATKVDRLLQIRRNFA